MSFLSALLEGVQIAQVHSDSELTYLILSNGTQITVRGLLMVEPTSSWLGTLCGAAAVPVS